jgi:ferredoxin
MTDTIIFELDGIAVEAQPGETIWQVAKRQGHEIPHLCFKDAPDYRPDGNCRVCMVEIEGERVLAASCKRMPAVGMKVKSQSERATKAQMMVMELLVADQPTREESHDRIRNSGTGPTGWRSIQAASPPPSAGRAIRAIPRCASILMRASNAACACAPAARCRSMT